MAMVPAEAARKARAHRSAQFQVEMGDIASSPLDALAAMVGEKDAPKTIAQGVLDFNDLPADGEEREIAIPLERPLTGKTIGTLALLVR